MPCHLNCYTITRFAYYPQLTQPVYDEQRVPSPERCDVSITMISHGDKSEIRIANDEEAATDIKKEVVRAYRC